MAENEVGAFLRSRRELVTPAEVGLPAGPRRRTPGLRRAELATLAGVSVEYLIRLEQGRDRHPSSEIVTALANALNLSYDERVHLHRLVKGTSCQATEPRSWEIRPTVGALLDRLDPSPAVVVSRVGDLVAANSSYRRLARPLGLLDADQPNLTRFVFADPRAKTAYPDWNQVADERAADLRAATALGDPHAAFLGEELAVIVGTPFSSRYDNAASLPERVGVERWTHPLAGELVLAYESLELPHSDEQRLVAYLAADDATSVALESLSRTALTN
ncbi:helix-turn-helix transcriptional regulator [Fodinicola feengrottensis]|uniref:Helix-turn-helix transcriptional regulator n=1 Tax=Fodinicola feengrottensis TaxID=435914 RepID=A0ABN2FWX9_9ACTN